jgi:signal recognition particle GTPase
LDYEGIFNTSLPIELYYKVIHIHQTVESALKAYNSPKLTRPQIGDIKFHVTMYLVCRLTNKLKPKAQEIADIKIEEMTNELITESIVNSYVVYDAMGGNNGVAKGKEFVQEVLGQLKENLIEKKNEV